MPEKETETHRELEGAMWSDFGTLDQKRFHGDSEM